MYDVRFVDFAKLPRYSDCVHLTSYTVHKPAANVHEFYVPEKATLLACISSCTVIDILPGPA